MLNNLFSLDTLFLLLCCLDIMSALISNALSSFTNYIYTKKYVQLAGQLFTCTFLMIYSVLTILVYSAFEFEKYHIFFSQNIILKRALISILHRALISILHLLKMSLTLTKNILEPEKRDMLYLENCRNFFSCIKNVSCIPREIVKKKLKLIKQFVNPLFTADQSDKSQGIRGLTSSTNIQLKHSYLSLTRQVLLLDNPAQLSFLVLKNEEKN